VPAPAGQAANAAYCWENDMSITFDTPMSYQAWNSHTELHIPSEPSAGKQAVDQLLSHLERNQWVENDIFGVHLAVEEALVNAIKHGNQNDRTKKVHIIYKMSDTHVRIEITDEGPGFDPGDVADPTDDENLELPSGRGLMLMRSFMSLVEFNERGNGVIMEKRRGDME
jgi:serine/threonine-protein kinase RsbW